MICIKCNENLDVQKNWSLHMEKKHHYVCKPCLNLKVKQRSKYKNARKTKKIKKIYSLKLSRKITNFMMDAKKRKKELELNYEEIGLIMQMPCNYCGAKESYNGLDRFDNSKGYLKNNVVPCCAICNRAKNSLTAEEYIQHCKNVLAHNGGL